jgi:GH15 family glucan-1,4-alpha-glucosidase
MVFGMARPITLSNGELHVGINNYGLVHDFYYPHVGFENHAAGKDLRHKVGVWIDGEMSWLDDGSWDFLFRTSAEALMGHSRAKHAGLDVILEFDDFVDAEKNIFLRNIHIVNLRTEPRQVRLFMHQAFVIGDSRSNTDTAQYLPSSQAVMHYRGRRVFVVSGRDEMGQPFDQQSIGLFGIEGREGTYRDAEDGELSNGTVEHGRVDSTLRFCVQLDGHSSSRIHYWITAGKTVREAVSLHKHLIENEHSFNDRQQKTLEWWHEWLIPTTKVAQKLPFERRQLFIKSAMVIKSHIDKNGAIIASTDTAMLNYSRDAYGYCWPRDGAYALWPLIRLGYTKEPLNFFLFMLGSLHTRGYLMHKYRADGALGSSWHPYVHGDITAPPIQEDETALVLFMYAQFYDVNPEVAVLPQFYEPFIKPMAQFLATFIDEETNLPRESYDLWEEKFLTSTYTTAVTHAALLAAADLADVMNDSGNAVKWRNVASDLMDAATKYLYDAQNGVARKGIVANKGVIDNDNTIDASSFYGLFMYGLFRANSDELNSIANKTLSTLRTPNSDMGIARYEHDQYRRKSDTAAPNPWIISSLWEAQYCLEIGQIERAMNILDWVQSLASTTGMFSEQIDPDDSSPISVEPLVWSHAEFMATVLDSLSDDGNKK